MQYKPNQKPHKADEDDDDCDGGDVRPFRVKSRETAMVHTAYVNSAFYDSRQFEKLVEILDAARPQDVVEIKLTSPGGSLWAVLPLLNAMAATQAKVFVHAVSDVASAGTFVLMMADDVFINPFATIMFHQVSYGAWGQGNHIEDRVGHVSRESKALLREMYRDFLTEEEMDRMFSGKEFWMTKEEFDARYAARTQAQQKRMEEEVAAAEAAAQPKPKRKRPKPPVAE